MLSARPPLQLLHHSLLHPSLKGNHHRYTICAQNPIKGSHRLENWRLQTHKNLLKLVEASSRLVLEQQSQHEQYNSQPKPRKRGFNSLPESHPVTVVHKKILGNKIEQGFNNADLPAEQLGVPDYHKEDKGGGEGDVPQEKEIC